MSLFGKSKSELLQEQLNSVNGENAKLLEEVKRHLDNIETHRRLLNETSNRVKELEKEKGNLTYTNNQISNQYASLESKYSTLLAQIKKIEENKERHERVLTELMSTNTTFTRTIMSLKVLNAENLRKLDGILKKYDFFVKDEKSIHSLSEDKEKRLFKIFYPSGGNYSPEAHALLKERNIRNYNTHTIETRIHEMVEEFIVINKLLQELENLSMEKTKNIKVMQAANELCSTVIKKYGYNMEYFEKSYLFEHRRGLIEGNSREGPKIIGNLEMSKEAYTALKNETMSEMHVETLNAQIVKLFRQILLETDYIKRKYESSVEINNVDIFSKEMVEMFKQFHSSFKIFIANLNSELLKHEELSKKLTNEEDITLNHTIKSLGILVKSESDSQELIIKAAASNIK